MPLASTDEFVSSVGKKENQDRKLHMKRNETDLVMFGSLLKMVEFKWKNKKKKNKKNR